MPAAPDPLARRRGVRNWVGPAGEPRPAALLVGRVRALMPAESPGTVHGGARSDAIGRATEPGRAAGRAGGAGGTAPLTRRGAVAASLAVLAAPRVLRAQPAPVRLGLIHPVTGALSVGGQQCRLGAQTAIADINARGGIAALGGAPLEAVLGDAQGRPEVAAALVDQMAEAGVAGFVGCYANAVALAATTAAAQHGLPFSVDGGAADAITGRGLRGVFRFFPAASTVLDDAAAGLAAIDRAAGGPARSCVVVHEGDEADAEAARRLAGALKLVGLPAKELIAQASPLRDPTDLVLRVQAARPDILVITCRPADAHALARAVAQRGGAPWMACTAQGGLGLRFAQEQPGTAEGMLGFDTWYDAHGTRGPAFRRRIEDGGGAFGWEVLQGYVAVRLLADAVERAGSTGREEVAAALEASTYASPLLPYGPTRFNGGQNGGAHAVALQARGGDLRCVWPEQFADAAPVLPRRKSPG